MGVLIDLTGQKYGRLTVLNRAKSVNKHTFWKCVCECGNNVVVDSYNLRNGHTQSCGCYRQEVLEKARSPFITTHGMSRTRFYRIWRSMKKRCHDEKHPYYKDYGGRGISVCEEWRFSFENFYCDMYQSYLEHVEKYGEKDTTIDRVDNNGNYVYNNCKWSTQLEQHRNTRMSVYISINGEKYTPSEIGKTFGILPSTVLKRYRLGFTEDAIISKSHMGKPRDRVGEKNVD